RTCAPSRSVGWPYIIAPTEALQPCNSACLCRRKRSDFGPTQAALGIDPDGDRNHAATVEHSTPATHHNHPTESRRLALDHALRSISAENGPRPGLVQKFRATSRLPDL